MVQMVNIGSFGDYLWPMSIVSENWNIREHEIMVYVTFLSSNTTSSAKLT